MYRCVTYPLQGGSAGRFAGGAREASLARTGKLPLALSLSIEGRGVKSLKLFQP